MCTSGFCTILIVLYQDLHYTYYMYIRILYYSYCVYIRICTILIVCISGFVLLLLCVYQDFVLLLLCVYQDLYYSYCVSACMGCYNYLELFAIATTYLDCSFEFPTADVF